MQKRECAVQIEACFPACSEQDTAGLCRRLFGLKASTTREVDCRGGKREKRCSRRKGRRKGRGRGRKEGEEKGERSPKDQKKGKGRKEKEAGKEEIYNVERQQRG